MKRAIESGALPVFRRFDVPKPTVCSVVVVKFKIGGLTTRRATTASGCTVNENSSPLLIVRFVRIRTTALARSPDATAEGM
jgi:hypothetical protein